MNDRTCRRFDRDTETLTCRTCGRGVVFNPSRRPNSHPGDGNWQHIGPSIAEKLATLARNREVGQ